MIEAEIYEEDGEPNWNRNTSTSPSRGSGRRKTTLPSDYFDRILLPDTKKPSLKLRLIVSPVVAPVQMGEST